MVVLAAAICVVFWPRTQAPETEREAVGAYVAAVNAQDLQRLLDNLKPADVAQARRLLAAAKRPLVVGTLDIEHQFGPDVATARLSGTAAGQPFSVILPLVRSSGGWYLAAVTTDVNPAVGPSAATNTP